MVINDYILFFRKFLLIFLMDKIKWNKNYNEWYIIQDILHIILQKLLCISYYCQK